MTIIAIALLALLVGCIAFWIVFAAYLVRRKMR
jgi:hypothetical protein